MRTADFDYDLPEELIAQQPVEPRVLRPGDALVLNDTRVIAARLTGHLPTGGAAEALLLRQIDEAANVWEALVRPARRFRAGRTVVLGGEPAEVTEVLGEGFVRLRFPSGIDPSRLGTLPLPLYIHEQPT